MIDGSCQMLRRIKKMENAKQLSFGCQTATILFKFALKTMNNYFVIIDMDVKCFKHKRTTLTNVRYILSRHCLT